MQKNKQRKNRKKFILIALLIIIAGSVYYLNSMKVKINMPTENKNISIGLAEGEKKETTESAKNTKNAANDYIKDEGAIKKKSLIYQKAPELSGIDGYINTDKDIKIENLKGKVVLVDIWTYTCINCIRTLPYLKKWYEKYADDGLVIIGVHSPEFEFEKKYENVKEAAEKYQLKYPIVLDNEHQTWNAYNNRYWPHKYLIDIDGFVRFDHVGEGGYDETEKIIQELLQERMDRIGKGKIKDDMAEPSDAPDVDFSKIRTPEIYLGYEFTRGNFGNPEGLPAEQIVDYATPKVVKPNNIYLEGKWKINRDNAELVGDVGRILLGYDAKSVNIVASSGQGTLISTYLDAQSLNETEKGSDIKIINKQGTAYIKDEKLYNLVDYDYDSHLLELIIKGKGFKIYTFTFG